MCVVCSPAIYLSQLIKGLSHRNTFLSSSVLHVPFSGLPLLLQGTQLSCNLPRTCWKGGRNLNTTRERRKLSLYDIRLSRWKDKMDGRATNANTCQYWKEFSTNVFLMIVCNDLCFSCVVIVVVVAVWRDTTGQSPSMVWKVQQTNTVYICIYVYI